MIFCQASHFCPTKLPFLSCQAHLYFRGGLRLVGAFNQEMALIVAFSVIMNLRVDLRLKL